MDATREQLLAETLMEMQSVEPEGFEASEINSCDMIDANADHTIGMWSITYTTKQQ